MQGPKRKGSYFSISLHSLSLSGTSGEFAEVQSRKRGGLRALLFAFRFSLVRHHFLPSFFLFPRRRALTRQQRRVGQRNLSWFFYYSPLSLERHQRRDGSNARGGGRRNKGYEGERKKNKEGTYSEQKPALPPPSSSAPPSSASAPASSPLAPGRGGGASRDVTPGVDKHASRAAAAAAIVVVVIVRVPEAAETISRCHCCVCIG